MVFSTGIWNLYNFRWKNYLSINSSSKYLSVIPISPEKEWTCIIAFNYLISSCETMIIYNVAISLPNTFTWETIPGDRFPYCSDFCGILLNTFTVEISAVYDTWYGKKTKALYTSTVTCSFYANLWDARMITCEEYVKNPFWYVRFFMRKAFEYKQIFVRKSSETYPIRIHFTLNVTQTHVGSYTNFRKRKFSISLDFKRFRRAQYWTINIGRTR